IWNSGNVEILPDDFNTPITIEFGNKTKVLEAGVLGTKPNNIKGKVFISVEANSVTLKPLLLNSKDLVKLEILLTKFNGNLNEIKADARIAGVKQIYRSTENEPYITTISSAFFKMLLSTIGTLAVGAIFFLIVALFLSLVGQ